MTEKECAACEKVRGLTLSEEAWEVAVLNNHHALYQVAQLGLAVANAALSEKDARIAELKDLLDREMVLGLKMTKERDEARAARDKLLEQIFYVTELYAEPVRYKTSKGLKPNLSIGFETRYQQMYDTAVEFRRILDSSPPRAEAVLGPCEFPGCRDPKNERPDSWVHCVHDKSEHLWPHTVPANEMHHLLIAWRARPLASRANPPQPEEPKP